MCRKKCELLTEKVVHRGAPLLKFKCKISVFKSTDMTLWIKIKIPTTAFRFPSE